jgi:hypothetical protein
MQNFEYGVRLLSEDLGVELAAIASEEYVQKVQKAVDSLTNDMNSLQGYQTPIDQLKGDAAEFWHGDTFNIKAAVEGSKHRVVVERSQDFASADITGNFDKIFGLKFYKNGAESAKAQAKSVFEKYFDYKSRGGLDHLDKYLQDRNFQDESVLNDPIYLGQVRVIPKDQLEEAVAWLNRKIAKESSIRPEQVPRLVETRNMLSDRLFDGKGVESVSITADDARKLAELGIKGNFDPTVYGLSVKQLMTMRYILKQSLDAGISAAILSTVFSVAPHVVNAVEYLLQTGKIDKDELIAMGMDAVDASAGGFIKGTIASSIVISAKSGLLGNTMIQADPVVVGAITVFAFDIIKNAYLAASGKITRYDLTEKIVQETMVSSFSIVGGVIGRALITTVFPIGFMLGSLIGSIAGSLVYDAGRKLVITFCKDTGFTMFGLVEQNYKLPEDVVKEIGADVFEYDHFNYDHFEYDRFIPDMIENKRKVNDISLIRLRRGVIGINRIGYVTA